MLWKLRCHLNRLLFPPELMLLLDIVLAAAHQIQDNRLPYNSIIDAYM